jgi:histidinol dehydrogenase
MRLVSASDSSAIARLAGSDRSRDPRVRRQAARIVRDVERRGDAALLAWRRRLDGDRGPAEIDARDVRAGWDATPRTIRTAIRRAIRHVERVARAQVPRPFALAVCPGVRVEQRVQPLDRVACYVPGGRYPLPSTVVMTVVPARVAGVRQIVVCCPAPAPAVLCAAIEAGATRVFRMGGAHAIAALAYGTASVPRVDKIVGPGNAWVAAAKDLVAFDGGCAIDLHAGPSEIVILSDAAPAAWIAADLIAQAEHDPSARAIFVTSRRTLATAVLRAIRRRAPLAGPVRRCGTTAPSSSPTPAARPGTSSRAWRRSISSVMTPATSVTAARRAPSSSAAGARRPRATTVRGRITSCRPGARRGRAAASARPTSCASSPCNA